MRRFTVSDSEGGRKMNLFFLYLVELRRLALRKQIWLAAVLCLCTPILGYIVYKPAWSDILSDQYIANPALAATAAGAALWAAAVIMESSRLHRSGADVIMDAAASQTGLSVVRMAAMMTLAAAVAVVCALIYLPFTSAKMEYLFQLRFYLANYGVFVIPTWWISMLFADSFYQITRRVELSALMYAVFAAYSFSRNMDSDYFMSWLNPIVATYSDGFTSWWPLRIGAYTREMWLCAAAALWLVSLLCTRRYGKNLAGSFVKGMKRIYMPALAAVLAAAGIYMYQDQPFIDHGASEWIDENNIIASPVTDASSVRYSILAEPATGKLTGRAEYTLEKPYCGEDRILLNPGYKVKSMTYGGKKVEYRTVVDDLNGVRSTYFTLPDVPGETLVIEYGGLPTVSKVMSISDMIDDTIDPDYIVLGSASFVPLINYSCPEGSCTIDITIPDHLVPFLDYQEMTESSGQKNGMKTWTSECDIYIIDFKAANYMTQSFEAAGTQVDFVYGRSYHEAVEAYDVKQSMKEVLEYCTKHYGKLGFAEAQRLILLQVSSMAMGGHAWPGIAEWFETVLSPVTLSDPARGASATEVFIHEMIHQWWGGYGLNCDEDGLWSEEGLTVYSTYRLVKEKYGELYAEQYYVDKWKESVEAQNRDFYNRHPEYLEMLPESYQARIRSENSGINMYERMPLMILKAEKLVGGEKKMDQILRRMYTDREQYDDTMFSYQDFLDACGLDDEELKIE